MLLLERKWCGKDGIGAEVIDRDAKSELCSQFTLVKHQFVLSFVATFVMC